MGTILERGSTDDATVERLAEILYDQGYYDLKYPVKFDTQLEDAVIYFQQTHLGKNGKPLIVSGKVGNETWWALRHPSGKAQKSGLAPTVPKGITGERQAILEFALAQHAKGVKEIPSGSNRGPEIDKCLPQWWLNKHGPKDKGPAWCCFWVHYVYKQAIGRYPTSKLTGSCTKLMQDAKTEKVWRGVTITSDVDMVRPGAIFLITHPTKQGKPQTGHVGIVHCINREQTVISTIEGNCGNRVKCGLRSPYELAGFVDPLWEKGIDKLSFNHTLPKAGAVSKDGTR
jgi:hypothetical protein